MKEDNSRNLSIDSKKNEPGSIPANQLAENIISSCFRQQSDLLIRDLLQFKEKKNHNYEKFASHITNSLEKNKRISIENSLDMLQEIGDAAERSHNSEHQIKIISIGFTSFWARILRKQDEKIKKSTFRSVMEKYFRYHHAMSDTVASSLAQQIKGIPNKRASAQKKLKELIVQQIQNHRRLDEHLSKQCCHLVRHFNLYEHFEIKDLLYMIQNAKFDDIWLIFRGKEGQNRESLIKAYVNKKCSEDSKELKHIISKLHLNPNNYPSYIKALNKKSLNYFLQHQQIYQVDLKVKGRPDIIECLIQILIDRGDQKTALHFINKYKIAKFFHLQSKGTSFQANPLEKKDSFEPTEIIIDKIYKKSSPEYILISHFNLSRKDIEIVNSSNWQKHSEAIAQMLKHDKIGLDSETVPIFNAHQQRKISIIQASSSNRQKIEKTFIIDLLSLRQNGELRKWFEFLVAKFAGKIVGHTIEQDLLEIIKQLGLKVPIKASLLDVAKIFKKKYPEQTKSSLEYICERIFKKKLSKMEQCSGWQNRPLRQAQIHYAALDSIIPLKLCEALI